MIGAIVLQIVLIFLDSVFASAELAVVSVNGTKQEKMTKKGDGRPVGFASRYEKYLFAIQVSIASAESGRCVCRG